ncbi:MAG: CpaD family pilus assembly lipoprotein [Alphaproteobacteria bacterium]|nr:CpaD family pilus assembly lipoprotein [Alphaproteobacteria bacterium]
MIKYIPIKTLLVVGMVLSACAPTQPPVPDHRIKVVEYSGGAYSVVAPECEQWADYKPDPFSNQVWPQFGCSNARNLAAMIDNPRDLVAGRDMGDADAVNTTRGIDLYRTGKTKELLNLQDSAALTTSGK